MKAWTARRRGRCICRSAQARNVETAPTIVVRTAIDPAAMTLDRARGGRGHRSLPCRSIGSRRWSSWSRHRSAQPRFRTFLLAALSLLALVMASIGIYGVTNYLVVQRTREFGIALASARRRADVLRLVLGRAAVLIVAGLGSGCWHRVALTRLIAGLLFGVTPLDRQTFAAVRCCCSRVACLASYIPARRATRIDPMIALRYE